MGMAAKYGQHPAQRAAKKGRFIFPHGEVMIHQPSGGGRGTSADLEIMAEQIRLKQSRWAPDIGENCGQTYEKVMKGFWQGLLDGRQRIHCLTELLMGGW